MQFVVEIDDVIGSLWNGFELVTLRRNSLINRLNLSRLNCLSLCSKDKKNIEMNNSILLREFSLRTRLGKEFSKKLLVPHGLSVNIA